MQQRKKRESRIRRRNISLDRMTCAYLIRLVERLWAYIDIRGNNECWPWMGPQLRPHYVPYGSMKLKVHGKHAQIPAHRFLWLVENPRASLPESVCHSCDFSLCMNPRHLFAGSQIDNIRDCVNKGRSSRGSNHPSSRLKEKQVLEIRGDRRPHKEIAADYGISTKYVGSIKNKRWWKWL